jgi:hypothetical protein
MTGIVSNSDSLQLISGLTYSSLLRGGMKPIYPLFMGFLYFLGNSSEVILFVGLISILHCSRNEW